MPVDQPRESGPVDGINESKRRIAGVEHFEAQPLIVLFVVLRRTRDHLVRDIRGQD